MSGKLHQVCILLQVVYVKINFLKSGHLQQMVLQPARVVFDDIVDAAVCRSEFQSIDLVLFNGKSCRSRCTASIIVSIVFADILVLSYNHVGNRHKLSAILLQQT